MSDARKVDDGGSAYPTATYDQYAAMHGIGVTITDEKGMTLRDYFAAAALQGLLAHVIGVANARDEHDYAKRCYQYADAMLKARKEAQP